eukprot:g73512.t1
MRYLGHSVLASLLLWSAVLGEDKVAIEDSECGEKTECGCGKLSRTLASDTLAQAGAAEQIELKHEHATLLRDGQFDGFIPHRLVRVPAGSAWLGTNEQILPVDKEGPERYVTIPHDLLMDAYEVSNGQFAAFVRATGYISESERFGWSFVLSTMLRAEQREQQKGYADGAEWWSGIEGASWLYPEADRAHSVLEPVPAYPDLYVEQKQSKLVPATERASRLDHPVVHVSWNDARAFCRWRDMDLPSEEEWEYAARGGLEKAKVVSRRPTRQQMAGYGLYNMAGNVWEWTLTDSNIMAGDKIKKGGSFLCHKSYCYRYRVASRSGNTPDSAANNLGFRCVRKADSNSPAHTELEPHRPPTQTTLPFSQPSSFGVVLSPMYFPLIPVLESDLIRQVRQEAMPRTATNVSRRLYLVRSLCSSDFDKSPALTSSHITFLLIRGLDFPAFITQSRVASFIKVRVCRGFTVPRPFKAQPPTETKTEQVTWCLNWQYLGKCQSRNK